jgi:hypothetical protein
MLFIGGMQLIGIGILGEYIGRIYQEVKGRPTFIARPRSARVRPMKISDAGLLGTARQLEDAEP